MTIYQQIQSEHRALLRGLDILEDLYRGVEQGQRIPQALLDDVLSFFEIFGATHFSKEEACLFPLIEERQPAYEQSLSELTRQHAEWRAAFEELQAAVQRGNGGWLAEGRRVVDQLRGHIALEDSLLEDLLKEGLSITDEGALSRGFQAEEGRRSLESFRRTGALVESLCRCFSRSARHPEMAESEEA